MQPFHRKIGEGIIPGIVLCLIAVLMIVFSIIQRQDTIVAMPVHELEISEEAPTVVNINIANAEELQAIPGIGTSLAESIIADRNENGPFETPEDLCRVSGIGTAKLEAMRDFIRIE